MAYFSSFVPAHLKHFNPVILDAKESFEFYKKFNEEKKKENIEFRNNSDIKIQKKPCPCMANKIKQTPSS